MSERQTIAWLAAAGVAIAVAALFVRRSAYFVRAGTPYRRLGRATVIATAVAVGALMGLAVFLIVSALGG